MTAAGSGNARLEAPSVWPPMYGENRVGMETDPDTGRRYLKLPGQEDDAVERLAKALQAVLHLPRIGVTDRFMSSGKVRLRATHQ
ncbi:MAG: hypothetical protein JJU22_14875 [Gammaproteobacteria bacterium]|nr:hypothetical protein [Gammaproteobacteria bacterium]